MMAVTKAKAAPPAPFKWTALDVEIAVANYFSFQRNLIVPNVSHGLGFYRQEIDVLVATPRGYLTEIEIKVSASDLRRDAGKRHGHPRHRFKQQFFAVPETLKNLALEITPPEWGVVTVHRDDYVCARTQRPAAVNRTAPPLTAEEFLKLRDLSYFRVWSLKKALQKRIQRDRLRDVR